MPVQPLPPDKLRFHCSEDLFTFESTTDLPPTKTIIGQPRGTRAIQFGIGIQSKGYNIFVLGPIGSGRGTAIEHFLQEQTSHESVPDDWVYVNNFGVTHQPRAIELPAGEGAVFKARMSQLVADLSRDLPQAFDTEQYENAMLEVREAFEAQQDAILDEVRGEAAQQGFTLVSSPSGFSVMPLHEGKPMSPELFQTLPTEEQQVLEKQRSAVVARLESALYRIHQLEREAQTRISEIDREVAESTIQHYFEHLREQYEEREELLLYLDEVYQDVLNQIDDFAPPLDNGDREIDLRRYEVNVLVDNNEQTGAPVVVERDPTYYNLFGRIEYEMQSGVVMTHFTNIKSGSLHRANGGYLIMDAEDLLKAGPAWMALKRGLRAQEIRVQLAATMDSSQVLAKSLDPEPIPLNVKIILTGNRAVYYALYDQDEEFTTFFKVRADFEATMPRTDEHVTQYASFVATRCHEEKLRHFDRSAVARVVEFGTRLASNQGKLSTRFGAVADLIREASYWSSGNGKGVVTAVDVQNALAERTYRANSIEELVREEIVDGVIFIATEGSVVGQVNGLSVLDTGDYAFGQPGRLTARTYMGDEGVVHIERETDMSGPIHEKGVLTLTGYLGGVYAQSQPLSLSAQLTFEQSYSEFDGDSAASTELYALLSSLANIPIKQGIAVTGSVNQRGEVQPIGGVNEKIEGFFRVCRECGLTGEQGVIIPASNVVNLALDDEVITAVAEGKFHIWPVSMIDEGIELLMGTPAGVMDEKGNFPEGTVHGAVQRRLRRFAERLKSSGDDDDDEDDSED